MWYFFECGTIRQKTDETFGFLLDAERWLSEEGFGNEEADFGAELLAELMEGGGGGADAYNVYAAVGGKVMALNESVAAEL